MNELIEINKYASDRKHDDYRMQAALAGVDIDSTGDSKTKTFEEMKRRAAIKAAGGDPDANDVAQLSGKLAEEEGFGVNVDGGLAYAVE